MKATDRCDRCNAQAYLMTLHSGNAMFWCVHHFTKYEYYLAKHVVKDDRERLTADI